MAHSGQHQHLCTIQDRHKVTVIQQGAACYLHKWQVNMTNTLSLLTWQTYSPCSFPPSLHWQHSTDHTPSCHHTPTFFSQYQLPSPSLNCLPHPSQCSIPLLFFSFQPCSHFYLLLTETPRSLPQHDKEINYFLYQVIFCITYQEGPTLLPGTLVGNPTLQSLSRPIMTIKQYLNLIQDNLFIILYLYDVIFVILC